MLTPAQGVSGASPVPSGAGTSDQPLVSDIVCPTVNSGWATGYILPSGNLSQRKITELPPEMLVAVFAFLEVEDLVSVRDTCRLLSAVVEHHFYVDLACHFFRKHPQTFQTRYVESVSWQKNCLRHHLAPFPLDLPEGCQTLKNPDQLAAVLCFHLLGAMERCQAYSLISKYQVVLSQGPGFPRERIERHQDVEFGACFSPAGGRLLLFGLGLGDALVMRMEPQGEWVAERLAFPDGSGPVSVKWGSFGRCGNHLLTYDNSDCVRSWRCTEGGWHKALEVAVCPGAVTRFSPSGKYVMTQAQDQTLKFWRVTGQGELQPMSVDFNVGSRRVREAVFSPSDKHIALSYGKSIAILFCNDQGNWALWRYSAVRSRIDFVRFSPLGKRLLYGVCCSFVSSGEVKLLSLNEHQFICEEILCFPEWMPLLFSPGGNFLVCTYGRNVLFWQIEEEYWKVKWGNYRRSTNWTNIVSNALKDKEICIRHAEAVTGSAFSPCDRYLLIGGENGRVCIRGKNTDSDWPVLGEFWHNHRIQHLCFSSSGAHALSCDQSTIAVWGRKSDNTWLVKGMVHHGSISCVYFNPVAEYQVVVMGHDASVRILEITPGDDSGMAPVPPIKGKLLLLVGEQTRLYHIVPGVFFFATIFTAPSVSRQPIIFSNLVWTTSQHSGRIPRLFKWLAVNMHGQAGFMSCILSGD